jgi:hypothetical protein
VTSENVDLAKVSEFGGLLKVILLSRVTLFFILNPYSTGSGNSIE